MPPPKLGRRMEKRKESPIDQTLCKRIARVMLSHVGLFIIVAIYAVVGAYIFMGLEYDREVLNNKFKKKVTLDIIDSKNYIINDMWFQNSVNHTATQFKAIAMNNLKQFHDFIVSGVSNNNYDGELETEVFDWTFTNSLLFTFTTIAAIGYGHISPKTFNGQIFCIVYGLIGVPLLLVFLDNIGDPMAHAFRYTYSRGCCVIFRLNRRKNEVKKGMKAESIFKEVVGNEPYMPTDEVQVPITVTACLLLFYLGVGGILFQLIEGWDFYESMYFSFITLSTIGFGDYVPGESFNIETGGIFMAVVKMMATIGFSIFGMALLSMCINLIQESVVSKFKSLAKELGSSGDDNKNDTKAKYRTTNADGSVTITPPGKDGNQDMPINKDGKQEKQLLHKFKRRKTYQDFDDL